MTGAGGGADLSMYTLKLYHMHPTRSVRALWACHELGLDVNVVPVALMEGEQHLPPFKEINPMSGVPTLVLTDADGKRTVMTESGAIVQLLAEASGGLMPPMGDVALRAAYHRWCTFATASMDPLLWTIRTHEQLLPESLALPKVAKRARHEFCDKVVPTLVEAVGGEGGWLAGDFSSADILVGYALFWAKLYGLVEKEELCAYLDRCKKRDAFQAAMGHEKKALLSKI